MLQPISPRGAITQTKAERHSEKLACTLQKSSSHERHKKNEDLFHHKEEKMDLTTKQNIVQTASWNSEEKNKNKKERLVL